MTDNFSAHNSFVCEKYFLSHIIQRFQNKIYVLSKTNVGLNMVLLILSITIKYEVRRGGGGWGGLAVPAVPRQEIKKSGSNY